MVVAVVLEQYIKLAYFRDGPDLARLSFASS